MEGMAGWMKWAIALLAGFAVIGLGFKYAGWLLTGFFILNCLGLILVVLLRSGKPDGVWAARGGECAVQGHHVVRGDVHGLRVCVGVAHGQSGGRWRIDFAEIQQAGSGECAGQDGGACRTSAYVVGPGGWRAGYPSTGACEALIRDCRSVLACA